MEGAASPCQDTHTKGGNKASRTSVNNQCEWMGSDGVVGGAGITP